MFSEAVLADTLLSIVLGPGYDWPKDKIKNILSNEIQTDSHESYKTKMYQADINAFDKVSCSRYKDDMDRLYEVAESFMNGWSSAHVLSGDFIRSSLMLIFDEPDDKVNGFASLLEEEICSNEVLFRKYIVSNSSKSELYERIFALQGGIFDRLSIKALYGYASEGNPVTYYKNYRKKFHTILQLTAYKMFDEQRIKIKQLEFKEIIKNRISENSDKIIFEFPIKNSCETGSDIEFVHKSIYEYFTAEYIYQAINKAVLEQDLLHFDNQLGMILKNGVLSDKILEFFYYKININEMMLESNVDFIKAAFNMMLSSGMNYEYLHTEHAERNKANIFYNMLKIIHAQTFTKLINFNETKSFFTHYIKTTSIYYSNLNLSHIDLSEADLSGINLKYADLRSANLKDANISGADLKGANLKNADLKKSDMSRVNLAGTSLAGAYLGGNKFHGAVFDRNSIRFIEAACPEQVYGVIIELDKGKFVSYEGYRKWLKKQGLEPIGADFIGADLKRIDFRNQDLVGEDLTRANLQEADLEGAFLTRAILTKANLSDANMQGAVMVKADLVMATLLRTDLTMANLSDTNLSGAYLNNADLTEADLSGANFTNARMIGVNFKGAYLNNTIFERAVIRDSLFDINNVTYFDSYYGCMIYNCNVALSNDKVISYNEYVKSAGEPENKNWYSSSTVVTHMLSRSEVDMLLDGITEDKTDSNYRANRSSFAFERILSQPEIDVLVEEVIKDEDTNKFTSEQ